MRRREAVRAGMLLGVGGTAGIAGCTSPSADPTLHEGFESGIDEWTTGAAIGPEVPRSEFDWSVDASDERAAAGERSLRVFTEGDHDDGTAWAVRPIDVEPDRAYTADVSARFWSESESFNTLRDAVMRLGPAPPETESDFPRPGLNTTPSARRRTAGSANRCGSRRAGGSTGSSGRRRPSRPTRSTSPSG